MNLIILFIVSVLVFTNCDNLKDPAPDIKPETPAELEHPISRKKREINVYTVSDYENAFVDPRVDDRLKEVIPQFLKSHVLWRVRHNGNCWITSALIFMLHEITSKGHEYFIQSLNRIKKSAQDFAIEDNQHVKKFIELLESINDNDDFKNTIEILNYADSYFILNMGLRQFIAEAVKDIKPKKAEEIRNYLSWGDVAGDAGELFLVWDFKYAAVSLLVGPARNINAITYANKSNESWNYNLNEDQFRKLVASIAKNYPLIAFVPMVNYADILVSKEFYLNFHK
ncbi:MAG: hypothetical protein KC505_09790 [Myxococcales bacterium]|nr:hypothetical protein [Myxococcales bacterium]